MYVFSILLVDKGPNLKCSLRIIFDFFLIQCNRHGVFKKHIITFILWIYCAFFVFQSFRRIYLGSTTVEVYLITLIVQFIHHETQNYYPSQMFLNPQNTSEQAIQKFFSGSICPKTTNDHFKSASHDTQRSLLLTRSSFALSN